GGGDVEAADRCGWRGKTQLVGLKRRELRAHPIVGSVAYVHAGARLREGAMATHLGDRHIAVPIREVLAVPGRGDALHGLESIGRRDHLWAVPAVEVEARVVATLAPGVVDRLLRGGHRGRKRDDRTRIEIAIGPSVQAFADARSERIVHRRVAERTGDAYAGELVLAVDCLDGPLDADDGVELEERDRGRGALQADAAILDALDHCGG